MNAVIVGAGQVAGGYDERPQSGKVRTHAMAYLHHDETQLVAVADPDAQRLRAFAERWELKHGFPGLADMLAETRPDLVSICTPDETHMTFLQTCLDAPCVRGVWCEKPLALTAQGIRELVAAYAAQDKALLVNYQRSFAAGYRQLAQDLAAQRFGDVQKVVVYYTKGIRHSGSHALALLLEWFGAPTRIHVSRAFMDGIDNDPTVDANLSFSSLDVQLIGLKESYYAYFEMQLFCEHAVLTLDDFARRMTVRHTHAERTASGHRELEDTAQVTDMGNAVAMLNTLDALVNCVRGTRADNAALAAEVLFVAAALAEQGLERIATQQ